MVLCSSLPLSSGIRNALLRANVLNTVARAREGVRNTSGFTAAAGCPRWGHPGDARGVPHPLPFPGYRIHYISTKYIQSFHMISRQLLVFRYIYLPSTSSHGPHVCPRIVCVRHGFLLSDFTRGEGRDGLPKSLRRPKWGPKCVLMGLKRVSLI